MDTLDARRIFLYPCTMGHCPFLLLLNTNERENFLSRCLQSEFWHHNQL